MRQMVLEQLSFKSKTLWALGESLRTVIRVKSEANSDKALRKWAVGHEKRGVISGGGWHGGLGLGWSGLGVLLIF